VKLSLLQEIVEAGKEFQVIANGLVFELGQVDSFD
jgi:hypothetical protein